MLPRAQAAGPCPACCCSVWRQVARPGNQPACTPLLQLQDAASARASQLSAGSWIQPLELPVFTASARATGCPSAAGPFSLRLSLC